MWRTRGTWAAQACSQGRGFGAYSKLSGEPGGAVSKEVTRSVHGFEVSSHCYGGSGLQSPVVEVEPSGEWPAGSREKGMVALGRGGGPVLEPKQESHTAGFPQHKDQGRAQAQLGLR